jgi:hypothetical protein
MSPFPAGDRSTTARREATIDFSESGLGGSEDQARQEPLENPMSKSTKLNRKSRRGLLTGAAVGTAGLIAKPPIALAPQAVQPASGIPLLKD